jgi:hypothetical protein
MASGLQLATREAYATAFLRKYHKIDTHSSNESEKVSQNRQALLE